MNKDSAVIISEPQNLKWSNEEVRQYIEKASGIPVTFEGGTGVEKLYISAAHTAILIQNVQLRTSLAIHKVETIRSQVIEAASAVTNPAFCANGEETRMAVKHGTDRLATALNQLDIVLKEIQGDYGDFIEPNQVNISAIKAYLFELRDYAIAYCTISLLGRNDDEYRNRLRESDAALKRLRDLADDKDYRLHELYDSLMGTEFKPIQIKRYIRKKAEEWKKKFPELEPGRLGVMVYHTLKNYKKPSSRQRNSIETLSSFFRDDGEIIDQGGLRQFMISAMALKGQ